MPRVDPALLKAFKAGDIVLAKYDLKGEVLWIRPLTTKDPADFFMGTIDEKGFLTSMAGVRVEKGNA